LLDNISKELFPRYQEKFLTVNAQFEEDVPLIDTDPMLIRQVITNILSNAIKYTPENGAISISIKNEGSIVEVRISDTGIGIPQEEQPKIFERFFRASNVKDKFTEGTGLGLFIAKLIVELLGGTIGFYSQPDRGTAVCFPLPIKKPQA
jgi:signal transduction histidine kinase